MWLDIGCPNMRVVELRPCPNVSTAVSETRFRDTNNGLECRAQSIWHVLYTISDILFLCYNLLRWSLSIRLYRNHPIGSTQP